MSKKNGHKQTQHTHRASLHAHYHAAVGTHVDTHALPAPAQPQSTRVHPSDLPHNRPHAHDHLATSPAPNRRCVQPSAGAGPPPRPSAIHGTNRWPASAPALRPAVEDYTRRMAAVGAAIMRGIALGLRLPETFFQDRDGPCDPYWCMRIIHYPPLASAQPAPDAHLPTGGSGGCAGAASSAADTMEKALAGAPCCVLRGWRRVLSGHK